jgi:signal transduction histidine kinase
MFARVLIVLDSRVDSRDALVLGAQLADEDGALIVAHVLETIAAPLTGGGQAAASRREQLRDYGEEVYATLGPDPRVRYLPVSGLPLTEAARALADRERAEVIVIGQNLLGRNGSAHRLIDRARCLVAVAPSVIASSGNRRSRGSRSLTVASGAHVARSTSPRPSRAAPARASRRACRAPLAGWPARLAGSTSWSSLTLCRRSSVTRTARCCWFPTRPRYPAAPRRRDVSVRRSVSSTDSLDERRLARLIDVGRSLLSELDLDVVLDRVLETAADLTSARYAAVGILDDDRRELARLLTRGIDEETHRAIGDLPRGRGLLGVLIDDPRPLRLEDVGDHPRSYGFPPEHPPMRSFLGVPILIRGQAWGNLYLTEKAGGDAFTPEDEEATVVLADWAAIAIENARLYRDVTRRRDELERAVRGLEATTAIARAIGAETHLDRVLELVVKRGRALVEARDVLILLPDGDDLVIAAGAGHVKLSQEVRIPLGESTAGEVLAQGRSLRIADAARELRVPAERLGLKHAATALLVPLVYRNSSLGVLAAFDRMEGGGAFTRDHEQLLEAFAAQAATAVATAKTVQSDRLRRSLAAAEAERRRWARELHDETLQALGGLRVMLSSVARLDDPDAMRDAMRDAVEQLGADIQSLRSMIAELRPPALDELGLAPALTSLAKRTSTTTGLELRTEVELPAERFLTSEVETTVYRIVQESLTNVAKHAQASSVDLAIRCTGRELLITVSDDGVGFDPDAVRDGGFGLAGMRERVDLISGELSVRPGQSAGTVVSARLPLS